MSIQTIFSHQARQRRAVEHLVLRTLARNGYPETALLMESDLHLETDVSHPRYTLVFATWESDERYVAFADKVADDWQISLQIGDAAPRPLV